MSRITLQLLIVTCFAMVACTSPTPLPTATITPSPMPTPQVVELVNSPSPAIQTNMWWNEEIAERDLDLVEGLGFHWMKQSFAWRDIEGNAKGAYDWYRADGIVDSAEKRGLNLIVRLDRQPFWSQADGGAVHLENAPPGDYANFGDFCFAVASRYKGRIRAYQVWNEPNLAREWGGDAPDPEAYTELLKHCYEGIKRGDPDALVISAGMAPTGTGLPIALPDDEFIRRMYEAGAAQYMDMLGVNAPGYAAPPETSPEEAAATVAYGGYRWATFRHVEDIRALMVEMGDGHKQIAILEMGWTTDPNNPDYSWFRVTEEQQAEYLVNAYQWAYDHWRPWIGIMTTIYIADPYWTPNMEQYWWAITLPDFPSTVTRPAYDALSQLPDWGADSSEPTAAP